MVTPESARRVMETYGADIIRLWAMSIDFTEDHRIGDEILKGVADQYRKLRNTFRYLLGALEGFSEAERVSDVAALIRLSRRTLRVIGQNVTIALGLKAVFLVTTVLGVTGLWIAILAAMIGAFMAILNIQIVKETVEAKSHRLSARWTVESAQDAQSQHGIDIEARTAALTAWVASGLKEAILAASSRS